MELPVSSAPFHIPVAAVDVGYFSTKYTSGRAANRQSSEIVVGSIPSICPRVTGEATATAGMSSLAGVVVTVNEVPHFVGPDASLRSSGREARAVLDDYARSDAYKALFLGALHYICRAALPADSKATVIEIKRLVVGLPLNTLFAQTEALRTMVEGAHTIPALPYGNQELQVVVRSCTVVAQPQGAMISHGAMSGNAQAFFKQNILVLDIGGGTFDWYLSHGKKALVERCGAYPKGMLECAFAVCDRIDRTLRDDPIIVSRVDEALRENSDTVMISGEPVNIAMHRATVNAILRECLTRMLDSVKSLKSVDLILFAGGGGQRLLEVMTEMHPTRAASMKLVPDPVFSNVRGFHMLGELMNNAK